MNQLLVLILAIFIAGYLFELALDWLNLRARNNAIPAVLADVYPPERYALQQQYEVETTRFSFLQGFMGFVATLVVLSYGLLGWLHQWVLGFELGQIATTLVFFGVIGVVAWVTSLPFSIWATFVIEEKYGFNRTTPKLFVVDSIKSILLSVIIGGGLLALITWIFHATGQWFWIMAVGVMLAFSLLANALYSRVIVPLFNKQEPLKEGELLDSIRAFGQKVGFPVSKVFVIDGSKRSSKANAYFSGFGSNRRVVLYDTLIEKMNHDEILAVLAHEVGHYRKRHIWINFTLGAIQSMVVLFIFSRVAQSVSLSVALGFSNATEPVFHLSLLAFGILFSPIETVIGLFTNMLSRAMEYQADAFARQHGFSRGLVSGLKKLTAENLSNLTPHPAYVFVNYSHPTLFQRVSRLLG